MYKLDLGREKLNIPGFPDIDFGEITFKGIWKWIAKLVLVPIAEQLLSHVVEKLVELIEWLFEQGYNSKDEVIAAVRDFFNKLIDKLG